MEISAIKKNASATHRVIIDPGKRKDGSDAAGFVIVGPNSPQYHEAMSRLIAHYQGEREKDEAEKKEAITFEKYMETKGQMLETCKIIAVPCVVDIFGFTDAGKPVPFSPATVEAFFDACPDWAFLVKAEVERLANFLKG